MTASLPSRIPLFPLPDTVLFPHVPLPLHIFEPRYRTMIEEALAGPRVIGMVMLKPGWEPAYQGRPPIFRVGCAGIISQHEQLPDGRYNIVLLGQSAFSVTAEDDSRPYRIGHVVYRPDAPPENPAEIREMRARLLARINSLARSGGAAGDLVDEQSTGPIPDVEFVNVLGALLDLKPLEKQALLETSGTAARYRKLLDLVEFWGLMQGRPRGPVQ